jgi:hypothetical protein
MSTLQSVISKGTRASQPAAASVPIGELYFVTDEWTLERNNGSSWDPYNEFPTFYNAGNTSTALTLDWTNGRKQRCVLTGNVTFTLSNPTDGARYIINISTGTGGFTVTWPAAVLWSGGVTPTITATASKHDVVILIYDATAAKYYGVISQNY